MTMHKGGRGREGGRPSAHRALTREVVAQRLSLPNGPEHMMHYSQEAFPFAYELFCEGDPAACAFLCRCARQEKYARQLNGLLGEREPLQRALLSKHPKLRKNAAVLMGQLKSPSDVKYLKQALLAEETRYVRPSMLLALGAIGGEEAREALAAYRVQPPASEEERVHFAAETEAYKTAMRSFLTFEKHLFTALPKPCEIELRSPDRLSDPLARELSEHGFRPSALHRGDVHVHTDDITGLFACRCFTEALIEISANSNPDPKSMGIKARGFLERLLPACHTGKPPFGYRLEIRGEGNVDRLSIARKMIAAMDGETLLNCPNNYEVEIRVEIKGNGGAFMYAKLLTIKDERFSYRLQALPASMHPATAAAILKYAEFFLGGKDARVLDPCCGSGTFLIEREKLYPCAALTGVDISDRAVDIARANAKAAGSIARFVHNDCMRFAADRPYDELVANLPFGNRVGSHKSNERLYAGILECLPGWLRPGGVAILYTMEYTLLKKLIRERPGLRLVTEVRTDAGGLMPAVFVIKIGQ